MIETILEPTSYTAEHVKAVRQSTGLSQVLFALALGVSPMAVRHWEQGRIKPSVVASRMLDILESDGGIISDYIKRDSTTEGV